MPGYFILQSKRHLRATIMIGHLLEKDYELEINDNAVFYWVFKYNNFSYKIAYNSGCFHINTSGFTLCYDENIYVEYDTTWEKSFANAYKKIKLKIMGIDKAINALKIKRGL